MLVAYQYGGPTMWEAAVAYELGAFLWWPMHISQRIWQNPHIISIAYSFQRFALHLGINVSVPLFPFYLCSAFLEKECMMFRD